MSAENPPRPAARRGRKPKPRVLELYIALARIEPPIWRHVRVPDAYTLDQLHRVIQLVFGWRDDRPYGFEAGERRFQEPRDEAQGESSMDTRLSDLTLGKGAELRYVYGFDDCWVHEIVVRDVYIINPFGEDDERLLPKLYGGARAAPREDSGGPEGYREMSEALNDPRHPEHQYCRRWATAHDLEQFDTRMVANCLTLAAVWGAV